MADAELPDFGTLQVGVEVDPAEEENAEVKIEMTLDGGVVLLLAFPNDGPADREAISTLFVVATQAWPSILEQLEVSQ